MNHLELCLLSSACYLLGAASPSLLAQAPQIEAAPALKLEAADAPADGDANAKPKAEGAAEEEATSWLGVMMEQISALQLEDGEEAPAGVGILRVIEGSPAAKAGIKEGDRVLKIDEKELKNEMDLRNTVRSHKPGTEIVAKVQRDGKEIDIKVTLDKMPAQVAPQLALDPFLEQGISAKPDVVRFSSAVIPREATNKDFVNLRDGNKLEGRVLALTDDEALLKMDSGVEAPLERSGVANVRVSSPGWFTGTSDALLLRDGSFLLGDKLRFDGAKFSLAVGDTTVTMDKVWVDTAVLHQEANACLYQGPRPNDGWKAWPENGWKLENGVWITSAENVGGGFLSKKFSRLPDAFELSFDAEDQGNGFQFILGSQRNTTDDLFGSPGAMRFVVSVTNLHASQFDGIRHHNFARKADDQPLVIEKSNAPKRRYTVRWRRTTGDCQIFVDAKLVGELQVAKITRENLDKAGRVFRIMGYGQAFRISNITLRPWLENEPPSPANEALDSLDLTLRGPDRVLGITENEILLEKDGKVARGTPWMVRLKHADPMPADTSRMWVELQNGSVTAAASLTRDQASLSLSHDAFGKAIFPAEALRYVEFHGANAASPDGKLDVLTFTNGRQLRGNFSGPLTDAKVRWKLSAAKMPLEFDMAKVQGLLLAPRPDTVPVTGNQVIRLTNGDWLPGDLAEVSPTHLEWKTSFTPTLSLAKASVQSLFPAASAATLADTASGRTPWKTQWNSGSYTGGKPTAENEEVESPWTYHDGTYALSSSSTTQITPTSLMMPLPQSNRPVSVEFTLENSEGWFSAQVLNRSGSSIFSIFHSGNSLNVVRTASSQARPNGVFVRPEQHQFQLPKNAQAGGGTRFQFVFDSFKKALHFGCEGKLLGSSRFKSGEDWPEFDAISFQTSYGRASSCKLSQVWISPWNGSMSGAKVAEPGKISLFLANGDETIGTLVSIANEAIEIDCEAGMISLPLSRVQVIDFQPPAKPAPAPYRIRLFDRGLLSATKLVVDQTTLTATTAHGEISLPLSSVKEIVFAHAP